MRVRTDPPNTRREAGIRGHGSVERIAFRGAVDGLERLRAAVRRLEKTVPVEHRQDDDPPS